MPTGVSPVNWLKRRSIRLKRSAKRESANTGSADKVLSAIINLLNIHSKAQHKGKHCLSAI
ncbi:hypothetical protein UUU_18520 [Klebsiella pneumoniae subsp. pneumoniae DSM 30104 = JCM 1662 = NBRC 14940]|nr:hypothetical protein UUU_18520 [Klebsiella pneumoniae subsp. pneumoniae DSM 30104 = JCM 1662 = NBRC 14940]